MKRYILPTATALVLALGLGTAVAAESGSTMSKSSTSAMTSDSLSLTNSQQKSAWSVISKQAKTQTLPSGFSAVKGSVVPADVTLQPVPVEAANRVPTLRPYQYAMAQNKILIVNPSDKKIVDVITKG